MIRQTCLRQKAKQPNKARLHINVNKYNKCAYAYIIRLVLHTCLLHSFTYQAITIPDTVYVQIVYLAVFNALEGPSITVSRCRVLKRHVGCIHFQDLPPPTPGVVVYSSARPEKAFRYLDSTSRQTPDRAIWHVKQKAKIHCGNVLICQDLPRAQKNFQIKAK